MFKYERVIYAAACIHTKRSCLLSLISIHQFLASMRLFEIDILRSHGEYQITLQLHQRTIRALKCGHLLHNKNVLKGQNKLPTIFLDHYVYDTVNVQIELQNILFLA